MNRKIVCVKIALGAGLAILCFYFLTGFNISTARASKTGSLSTFQGPQQMEGLWSDTTEGAIRQSQPTFGQSDQVRVLPAHFRTITLNRDLLTERLGQTPHESAQSLNTIPGDQSTITLPLPDGSSGRFAITESPIMSAELAAEFPEIKTYRGQGIDDPTATLRFVWSPDGFHATVLSGGDTVYIDPYQPQDTTNYISYFRQDAVGRGIKCGVDSDKLPTKTTRSRSKVARSSGAVPAFSNGTQLRTLRLAVAATAQFTAINGGTVNSAMAAIVNAINNTNLIFEREIALRLVLIPQQAQLIYTNAANQPYNNADNTAMLGQNQTNIDNLIGNANYDIGYVLGTTGGGVASTGSAGQAGLKAQGASGFRTAVGTDADDLVTVPHEMAHQFSGRHAFNAKISNCEQRDQTGAIEPGSASTIMGYAGACGDTANLQLVDDSYFNNQTLTEMMDYLTNRIGDVGTNSATNNTPPTVTVGPTYTIPSRTPFALTAVGNDVNGDAITYDWEEVDRGTAAPPEGDDGTRPIFRSYNPTTSPTRTFPSIQYVLNNANNPPATYTNNGNQFITGETLPVTTRTMNFRVTVRDNRAGGGGAVDAVEQVNVRADSGPFIVTQPNTAITWAGGSTQTVTWNVANTSQAPVSATNVRILLSTDGGATFPTVLNNNTPNTGTADVIIPNVGVNTARIKVEAVGNIFFDVSDVNFNITAVNPQGPDLAMAMTHTGNFTAGTNGTYNLAVTNVGTAVTTGPITVTNTLPNGMGFVSGTGAGWACLAAGQNVTCTNPGPLNAGANSAITLVVNVTNAAAGNTTNTATVATAGDANIANNTAADATLSCAYALNSNGTTFEPGGFNSGIGVTATAGCSWTAASNAPWLIVRSGTPGNGNGTVMYEVRPNNTGTTTRIGTMLIAAQTFTVTQTGDPTAVVISQITPTSVPAGSGDTTITLTGVNYDNTASVGILREGTAGNFAGQQTNFVSATQLTVLLQAADLATAGVYRVRVFLGNNKQSGDVLFTVTAAGVTRAAKAAAAPGQTVTVTNRDATQDMPWIEAELLNDGNDGADEIEVDTFSANPTTKLMPDVGGGFVELIVTGAGSTDQVDATIYYRQAVTDADKDLLRLWYFNGTKWQPVRDSGGGAPEHNIVGEPGSTNPGIGVSLNSNFVLTFDDTSSPKITELSNGVFFTFALGQYGDLNFDDKVNVQDLFILANGLAGNSHPDRRSSDVLLDGKFNVQDLFVLANRLAGNVGELPLLPQQAAAPGGAKQQSVSTITRGSIAPARRSRQIKRR